MDDAKTQLRFKGVKVPIAVEQRVVANQAERRDEAINGLAYRQTARPQVSIVVSRGEREGDGARLEYFEVPEVPEYATCLRFGADALKHFAEDQIRQAQTLARQLSIQPLGLGRGGTVQVVDPDRRVDDDHGLTVCREAIRTALIEITFPVDASAEPSDVGLRLRLDEQAQRRLDHVPLRLATAGAHRRSHQLIVDLDVRAHRQPSQCVMMNDSYTCVKARNSPVNS